jgi:hypothetical protein
MSVDFQQYTADTAVEELTAIERHLLGFVGIAETNSTEIFCLECIGKHISHIGALANEGLQFFPDDTELWTKVRNYKEGLLREGRKGTVKGEMVRKWLDDTRVLRKKLQEKYMGNFGRCECVTGLEPCCHGKGKAA